MDPEPVLPAFATNVLGYLGPTALAACQAVSRNWASQAADEILWLSLCTRDLGGEDLVWKLPKESAKAYYKEQQQQQQQQMPRAMLIATNTATQLRDDPDLEALSRTAYVLLKVEPLNRFAYHMLSQPDLIFLVIIYFITKFLSKIILFLNIHHTRHL